MRELIFRYRFLNRKSGEVIEQVMTISQIEHCPFQPNPFEGFDWEILSRDVWTGLLDKSGTRIFEGDVVKDIRIDGDRYDESAVVFKAGCFGLNVPYNGRRYEPCLYEADERYIQIIGHIYQPEFAHLRGE
jgi:hypothetical protein